MLYIVIIVISIMIIIIIMVIISNDTTTNNIKSIILLLLLILIMIVIIHNVKFDAMISSPAFVADAQEKTGKLREVVDHVTGLIISYNIISY